MPALHSVKDSIAYWAQFALLQVFGPAEQDREHDPIEQLKQKYHRPPRKW